MTGFVKGMLQDVGQLGQNVAQGVGYEGINQAVADAKQKALQSGVDPSLVVGLFQYDPNLPSLHMLSDLLVYSAAEAIAGQSGRGVSNEDVKRLRGAVGDPREWMTSQAGYLSKLETIDEIAKSYRGINDEALRRSTPPGAAPAAPGATEAERWRRGPGGQLQRVE